ncbi:MAG TPA: NAD-dependent epimerase, partial [Microbacterium sp.]|nr:NAD-dependent epimerase [Microbacterium sp.]HCU77139.1 NAD-dependent epimerase [Microbacterium sp.]
MSSAPHVIVGAGPVGSSLARILAGDGEPVIVVTRSGSELGGDGIRSIAADASDPEALTRIASGAAAIYNCANPGSYTQWERLWPPLGSALLTAAESTGAVLVTMSNLYGYGPVTEPMTAQMPLNPTDHKGALRARMWEEARAAHEAGRIRATEARASDYIGPTLPAASGLLARYAQATLVGKPASVFADPDVPHAWTAIDDVARTLVMLGRDERAWGRPWLV